MIIGLLLIVILVVNNTYGTAFAQDGNHVLGCANTVKVTISYLPKQTADASAQVTLSNTGPGEHRGHADINIPGIGSGQLLVDFDNTSHRYVVVVSGLPGQTDDEADALLTQTDVCSDSPFKRPTHLLIIGIGSGSLEVTKVN